MTKIIGLTGGIGSGKTTVSRLFASWGVPVYIADEASKKILLEPAVFPALASIFGSEVFTKGLPDRKKIAAIVFSQPDKLQALNALIHPLVKKDFSLWLSKNQDRPFVVREAAILFESGTYLDCDKIITVTAPLELRIARVRQRDGSSRQSVLDRMANQWEDDRRIALSDFVIENTDLQNTQAQTRKIFRELTVV